MDKTQLAKIISEHKLWLQGSGGSRADLRDAYLRDADLTDAKFGWNNHELLAEAIIQNADGGIGLLLFASAVKSGPRNNWCWGWYLADDAPDVIKDNRDKALSILLRYVNDNDILPGKFAAWIGVRDGSEDDSEEVG